MPTWLVVLIVFLVLLAIVGCVQIVVGARDARLDMDSKIDRKTDTTVGASTDKVEESTTKSTTTTTIAPIDPDKDKLKK